MRALVVCNGGGIGDVFLATPVMRALRQRYEHITALTQPGHQAVISPHVADEVWTDTGNLLDLVNRLRAGNFDAAIVTWATARNAYALALARIPERVGQARRLYSPLFTKQIALASESGDHTTHWVEFLLDYARALGCDGPIQPLSLVDTNARSTATLLLGKYELSSGEYIILHSTRGIARERAGWPFSAFARLTLGLRERFARPVLLTGSAAEAPALNGIARRTGAINLAGETTLPVFAALAEQAKLVIAMDSGPMHLAAATGAPTLGLFLMRPDEPARWHPLGPRTAVVRNSYPCPAAHTKENCPDFACVRELALEPILTAAAGLLEQKGEA